MIPLFANPEYLVIGLLVLLVQGLVFLAFERRAWRRLQGFAQGGLLERLTESHSRQRLWVKNSLLLLVIFLLFTCLARPQWGANWEKAETRGIDLMIALDTSRSMLAEDITPNRLERSKLAILDLLDSVKGDRIGLIAFAGNAFLQCPLTLDYQAFRQTLFAIDTETIPVGGTDVAAAIDEAEAYFEKSDNERILILITDGEDLEASGVQRAREAAKRGTRILTVGVGSPDGELIPVRGPDGQMDFLRDASGNPVATKLDEGTLRRIAEASNGIYAPLGPTGNGLERAYDFSLAQMPEEERQESLQRIPIERFHWPLLFALFLLIMESLLTTRKGLLRIKSNAGLITLSLLTLLMSGLSSSNAEAGTVTEAQKAFKEGRFEESMTLYNEALQEDSENPKIFYNSGVSAYRAGRFEEALSNFEKTLRLAKPGLQAKAFHNAANSRVAYGFELLESQPVQTRDQWMAAVTDYENSIALDEDRASSSQNLEQLKSTIELYTHSLITEANPVEGGTVSGSARSFHNIPLPIRASAATGWIFSEWTGEGIESPDKAQTVIRLTSDATAIAQFVKTWNLTVLSDDPSMGTAGSSGTFREDQPVPIKAEPKDYFAFEKWVCEKAQIADASMAETELTLSQDATATASFVPAFKLSVEVDPEIGGKAGPSGFFEEYTSVPIQAEPRAGFEWVGWIGDAVKEPENPQSSITLTEDKIAIAQMNRIWNLVIVPLPEEGGSVEGAGNYPIGSTVDISATPNEGFSFEGWDGPGVSDPSNPSTQVTILSAEHNLFARFKQDEQDQDEQDNQDQDQQDQQQDQQDQSEDQQDQQDQNQDQQDQNQDQQDQQDQSDQQEDQEQQDQEQEEGQDQQDQGEQGEPQEPEEQSGEAGQSGAEEPIQEAQALGEMTQEEARQLLNALSESERFLPASERSQEAKSAESSKPGKNW